MINKLKDNPKKRKHNHFTMGKQGYDPKTARLMNQKKQEKKKK